MYKSRVFECQSVILQDVKYNPYSNYKEKNYRVYTNRNEKGNKQFQDKKNHYIQKETVMQEMRGKLQGTQKRSSEMTELSFSLSILCLK